MLWYSHLSQNLPRFIVIHTVKGFGIANKEEIDVFLELSYESYVIQQTLDQYEKAKEPEIKLPASVGSSKKQESSRKTSTSALLTLPKPLTVWITINCKILKEIGMPDHLTCLLRNLYAGLEATVRTGHGTTDCFQIGKGVCQGGILSPCLNLYAKYIM